MTVVRKLVSVVTRAEVPRYEPMTHIRYFPQFWNRSKGFGFRVLASLCHERVCVSVFFVNITSACVFGSRIQCPCLVIIYAMFSLAMNGTAGIFTCFRLIQIMLYSSSCTWPNKTVQYKVLCTDRCRVRDRKCGPVCAATCVKLSSRI